MHDLQIGGVVFAVWELRAPCLKGKVLYLYVSRCFFFFLEKSLFRRNGDGSSKKVEDKKKYVYARVRKQVLF